MHSSINSFTAPIDARRLDSGWRVTLMTVAAALAALLILFLETAATAVQVWSGSATFNHCFLVLPISCYLIWQHRHEVARMVPRPCVWGVAVVAAMGALWLLGDLARFNEAKHFALVGMIQGVLLTLLGRAVYGRLWFPFLYLFFLVPTGEFLVRPLQDFTAGFVVTGLELIGIPVYSDGILIQIPNGAFQVAEACAGLRFLIASLAFGALFGYVVYRSPRRRLAFFGASIVVPIIANGVRALGIVLIAHVTDNRVAVGVDHIVYGWGFFAAVMLMLTWIGFKLQDEPGAARRGGGGGRAAKPAVVGLAAGIVIAVAALPKAYALHMVALIPPADLAALVPPRAGPGWTRLGEDADWRPVLPGVDGEASAIYARAGERVYAYVGFFVRQEDSKKVVSTQNRIADDEVWRRVGGGSADAIIDGQPLTVRVDRIAGDGRQRLLWQWYWVDGRFTADPALAKALQVKAELLGGTRSAAVIVLAADYGERPAEAEASLTAFLATMQPLAPQLARVAAPGGD